jgi:plasmid stabilization system protein ParE
MIVVITDTAEDDLERIGDYIALYNPTRALSFVRELREKCESLADMPRRHPLVPRYETKGVRR